MKESIGGGGLRLALWQREWRCWRGNVACAPKVGHSAMFPKQVTERGLLAGLPAPWVAPAVEAGYHHDLIVLYLDE
jgi:hypothetical protein